MKNLNGHCQGNIVLIVVIYGFFTLGLFLPCIAGPADNNPGIAPINASPYGKTYSEWAAEWWHWALETPVESNPVNTGNCYDAQKGHVWFIYGTFGGPSPVDRTCTVPSGTALFFPLLNTCVFGIDPDPPSVQELRDLLSCTVPSDLEVTIDGAAIKNPTQYFEESAVFELHMPFPNILGWDPAWWDLSELYLHPGVDLGYYLFLYPLPVGKHEISFKGSWLCSGNAEPFGLDVTYHIEVEPHSSSMHR